MQLPQKVKNIVRKFDENVKVVMFGSRARGEHKHDSDWDFLILLNISLNHEVESQIRDKLYELELASGEVISPVIEENTRWKDLAVTPLYKSIQNDGVKIN